MRTSLASLLVLYLKYRRHLASNQLVPVDPGGSIALMMSKGVGGYVTNLLSK